MYVCMYVSVYVYIYIYMYIYIYIYIYLRLGGNCLEIFEIVSGNWAYALPQSLSLNFDLISG